MIRTPLAWHLLVHRKPRTLAALAGVSMAIVLVFLQLGFYRAGFVSSVLVFEQFDYDLILTSPRYVVLRQAGHLPRARLEQARAVDGVARVAPLYAGVRRARIPGAAVRREVLVIGVDPSRHLLRVPDIGALLPRIAPLDTALVDTKQGPGYEGLAAGAIAELDGRRVRIVGEYRHGAGFAGNAALLVGHRTFSSVFAGSPVERVSAGLVDLAPGADPERVAARLREVLPAHTRVMTRAQQVTLEQDFSIHVKPVGIMFTSGLLLAFVVGAVLLYQILASEVTNHLREYATLKAMGYSRASLQRVVWEQALLFSALGFVPALLASIGIYLLVDATTTLPTRMSLDKVAIVLATTVVMCVSAGLLAVRKVERAAPADLF